MINKVGYSTCILLSVLALSACDNEPEKVSDGLIKAEKIAIGTDINTIVKPQNTKSEPNKASSASGQAINDETYETITWEKLETPGNTVTDIIEKFEEEIKNTPEGSTKEKEVMKRMQVALNSAPVNEALDKKRIKLPGFISPLEIDEKGGVVKEFLLVPYFGACIHVPPPPLNQTLLVQPKRDQQVKLEDAYEPVWVSGVIHAESTSTKLAEAGYKITDVKIEPYKEHR